MKPREQRREVRRDIRRRRRRPRTFSLPDDQMAHVVGVRAWFNGDCDRCPDPILLDDRVVKQGDGWIHTRCASGQDE
jgi:hypothetical protein